MNHAPRSCVTIDVIFAYKLNIPLIWFVCVILSFFQFHPISRWYFIVSPHVICAISAVSLLCALFGNIPSRFIWIVTILQRIYHFSAVFITLTDCKHVIYIAFVSVYMFIESVCVLSSICEYLYFLWVRDDPSWAEKLKTRKLHIPNKESLVRGEYTASSAKLC